MVLATGIENLQKVVERVRSEGQKAVADLVREMKALEQDASLTSLDELARLCRVGAETLQQLGLDDQSYAPHAEMVIEHLSRLVDFACACAVQSGKGGGAVEIVPPPLLTIPDPEEEKHFLETVGMFVSHAIGSVAELEEDILAVESSQDQVETIGGIRRVVHTMKAEFGVLNMGGPQQLCHQAETTIDACTESQRGFPVDVMLECADVLKQLGLTYSQTQQTVDAFREHDEKLLLESFQNRGDMQKLQDTVKAAVAALEQLFEADAKQE